MSDDDSEVYDPNLKHLVNDEKIKWVFVGGKGGVGKTTTSCSLALQFARQRAATNEKVLLISTDPAHNLSDAFQQKIKEEPTQIKGVDNLFAMETDPASTMKKMEEKEATTGDQGLQKQMADLMKNMPGVDEAMSFNELMNQVKTMEYSVVVFDTAPTGHTLRLLALPQTLEDGLGGLLNPSGPMGAMMGAMQGMMGGADPREKLAQAKAKVQEIADIFKDAERTTFVCVCIPEFLSVFETERLIQELAKFEIDCSNVVVNQVLYPESADCSLCSARSKMQAKYLSQIDDLYEDFHVVKMPLLHNEVRGVKDIEQFSNHLLNEFKPPQPK